MKNKCTLPKPLNQPEGTQIYYLTENLAERIIEFLDHATGLLLRSDPYHSKIAQGILKEMTE